MADLLQPLHGIAVIERRDQLQHATGRWGQLRLPGNGELLLEAGADKTDGRNRVRHGGVIE